MSELDQQFNDAVAFVRDSSDSAFKPSTDDKLQFYAFFKQATEGDVGGKKPGITDFVGRSKYNAWAKLKGQSKDQAKRGYIDLVAKIR